MSNSLKELMSWGLAKVVHVMGDRRDRFITMADVWDISDRIVDERKKREINPTLALLRECELEAAADTDLPVLSKKRITDMKTFLETLTEWHDQMQKIPRSTLLKMMKLGSKITRFLNL